jgi:hypothetical protein
VTPSDRFDLQHLVDGFVGAAGEAFDHLGVETPGQTAFTRMPCVAYSS